MMEIYYYKDSSGRQPVYEWFKEIQKNDQATWRKFYQLQIMLKENGKKIHSGAIKRKDIKKLKGMNIWQLRIYDNRILFFYSFIFLTMSLFLPTNLKRNRTARQRMK